MNPVPAATVAVQNVASLKAPPSADILALSQACNALWAATLSLMVAYMQTPAPAHRYLLARKIARNLSTLQQQPECFTADARASFAKLSRRWTEKADRLSPRQDRPSGGFGLVRPLLAGLFKSL